MRTLPLTPSLFHGWATTLVPSRQPIKCEPVVQPVLIFGLLLLMGSTAWGQITAPSEVEPYTLVPCVLAKDLPAGAYVMDGGWNVVGNAQQIVSKHEDPEKFKELVWVAPPGIYMVYFEGAIVEDVDVPLADGTTKKIHSYLGKIKVQAPVLVKGSVDPPPPPPVVNPYTPAPAYQAAVQPVKALVLSKADSQALAGIYSTVAIQVRAGQYKSLGEIRADLIKRGQLLSLKGKYPGLPQAVEQYLAASLGLEEAAPTASVGDVFETLAWAVFETGRVGR